MKLSPIEVKQLENRVGARTVAEVPPEVRAALSLGLVETKNLPEMLAFDYTVLFATVLKELGVSSPAALKKQFATVNELKIMGRLRGAAELFNSLSSSIPASRAKVPGGWLISITNGGMTFYPDPNHSWDGASL